MTQLRTLLASFWMLAIACTASDIEKPAPAPAPAAVEALPSYAEPSISPDNSEIAFVSGSDIWTVPSAGGEARLLVSHAATESRPLYSPDGKRLAFMSTRSGNADIYVLTMSSGDIKRITFEDTTEQLDAWSRDGKWIYFSTSGHDIASMSDIYRVSAEGGTPMAVSDDRYTSEFLAAPHPDGTTLAFNARGFGMRQWWRKGHSHLDESEIWLRKEVRPTEPAQYERVTNGGAKELWPMWNKDGSSLYYVSDKEGAQNIWFKNINGGARPVTSFTNGRVVWPTISYDGSKIVFERNFGIWLLDTASGSAKEVPITRRGAPAGPVSGDHLVLGNHFRDLALSPDGKKVAFAAHGEIFAASAKDGGEAVRVTRTTSVESNPCWSGDSKKLVYSSTRTGVAHLFMYDFSNGSETQLTNDALADTQPGFSPDGKLLAFLRGGRELCLYDLSTKQTRTAATAGFDRPPLNSKRPYVWSPDSRYVAYCAPLGKSFRNICVASASGGECKQVSFFSNVFSNTLSWSPDGTFLLLQSGQRTEKGSVARIDLVPRSLRFREDAFRDLFKDDSPRIRMPWSQAPNTPAPAETKPAETKPPVETKLPGETKTSPTRTPTDNKTPAEAPKPAPTTAPAPVVRPAPKHVEINFDSIRQRQSMLPTGLDVHAETISPDGKYAVLTVGTNLYTYSLDDAAGGSRPLVAAGGGKSDVQFSPDGREIYYLDSGHIDICSMDTRTPRTLSVTAELDVDFDKEKMTVFNQAWSYLRDHFFDDKYNGVDWNAARAEYGPRVAGARTPDEMRRIISMMLGELNASHMGISSGATSGDHVARLGLRFDRFEYETNGKLRVTEAIPNGPAAVGGIKAGEWILAIDGQKLSERTNTSELLAHKSGKRTVLSVAKDASAQPREVAVRPVNAATEKNLMYKQWVNQRREYVDKASGGRLGYVHMPDMMEASLNNLYVDLDAENHAREGVVIDVRNNDGGFVDPYAIDVLARRPYLMMTARGQVTAPGRTVLGQRALELPTVLVTNQHSLSDAESFTEGYRSLKLGKVVGEPTAGWIIFTSSEPLIDGSSIRIPHTRVKTTGGEDMEMKPRRVDLEVKRPVGESYTTRDSQLDIAVETLLKEVGKKK